MDNIAGLPLAGATVFVDDAAGVVSEVDGSFRVEAVSPPYDVAVRAGGSNGIRVYMGLERSDPTLVAAVGGLVERSATVSGEVTLNGTESGDTIICLLDGPNRLFGFASETSGGSTPIPWSMMTVGNDFRARWFGEASVNGTLHCVAERRSGSMLDAGWYAQASISLADGGDFGGRDLTLNATGVADVSGEIIDPDGAAAVELRVGPAFDNGRSFYVGELVSGTYSRQVAAIDGAWVRVGARDGIARATSRLVPSAPTIDEDITLLAAPAIAAPTMGAISVDPETPVRFSGGADGVFLLTLFITDGPRVDIVTTETTASLPDLARFGLAYPAGAEARVQVTEHGLLASMDAATQGTDFFDAVAAVGDYQFASSASVVFNFGN